MTQHIVNEGVDKHQMVWFDSWAGELRPHETPAKCRGFCFYPFAPARTHPNRAKLRMVRKRGTYLPYPSIPPPFWRDFDLYVIRNPLDGLRVVHGLRFADPPKPSP